MLPPTPVGGKCKYRVRFTKRKRKYIGRKEEFMAESALQAVNVAMRGGGYIRVPTKVPGM